MTAPSLYEVPMMLENEGLTDSVCHHLGLENREPDLTEWTAMTERQKANDQAALMSSLKNNPAFKDANGFFDPQKAMDYVRGLKKTVTVGGVTLDHSRGALLDPDRRPVWFSAGPQCRATRSDRGFGS